MPSGALLVLERFAAHQGAGTLLLEPFHVFRVKDAPTEIPPFASWAARPVYSRVSWLTYRAWPSGARTAIICGIMSTMVLSSDSDFLTAASALVSAA